MRSQLQLFAAMTDQDKQFFIDLGRRIAALRQELGMSQQRLGELLSASQQTVAHYEAARLRVPASMLPHLAKIFGVGVDDLIGQPSKPASKRGPAPKLQRHMERLSLLPKPKQRAVMEVIEAVLTQQAR